MKRFSILTSILLAFVAIPLQAGEGVAYSKNVAPIPPPLYGLGFYGAIDMGANVFQDRGGTKTFTNEFGDTLVVDPKNDVGFFGGIKGGYVFGTGVFRPTIEGDFFYNGFRGGAEFQNSSTMTEFPDSRILDFGPMRFRSRPDLFADEKTGLLIKGGRFT